jgi:hypothetical protein
MLQSLAHAKNFDVICLTETHLKYARNFNFIAGSDYYNVFRHDRAGGNGGGIAVLVRQSIPASVVSAIPLSNRTEALIIEVRLDTGVPLFVCCIYHPNGNQTMDQNILPFCDNLGGHKIICGDFNAKHANWGCNTSSNNNGIYINNILCDGIDLVIINDESPTRLPDSVNPIRPTSPSTIDLMLVSSSLLPNADFSVVGDVGSDHLMILCSLEADPEISPPRVRLDAFDFKSADWPAYQAELDALIAASNIEYNPLGTPESLELAAEVLQQCILQAARSTLAVKSDGRKEKPFLPRNIQRLIQERKDVLRQIKAGRLALCQRRNFLSRRISALIAAHEAKKWQKLCNTIHPPNIHTPAGQILRRFGKKCVPDVPLSVGGQRMRTDPEKSEAFAVNLYNAFQVQKDARFDRAHANTIANYIQNKPDLFKCLDSPTIDFDDNHPLAQPITPHDIASALRLAPNKSPGPDNIRNPLLSHGSARLHRLLARVYSSCLGLGYTPKPWKMADAIMIPKPDKDKSDPGNFRPISLLSVLGKLLERILALRISTYFENNNLFCEYQCGFRSARSTTDHLLRLSQAVHEGWSRNLTTSACFLDVAKAFDSVWHDALRFKLAQPNLGLPRKIIRFLSNYLDDRQCRVRVNSAVSPWFPINAGVPQGGSLSPLLYIIFANDIPLMLTPHTAPSQFADDLAIWAQSRHPRLASRYLQRQLDLVAQWCNKWRVKLNANKTELIYFVRRNSGRNLDKPRLLLNGQRVEPKRAVKFLGVIFDEHLNFDDHVRRIRRLCAPKLRALRTIATPDYGPNSATVIQLYLSYILPHIIYGCAAWSPLLSVQRLRLLDSLQNRACRIALRFPFWAPRTQLRRLTGLTTTGTTLLQHGKRYLQRASHGVRLISQLVNTPIAVPAARNRFRQTPLEVLLS